jgi:hypothetical protein
MINATLAIGDFMLMLVMAAMWVGGGLLLAALAALAAVSGALFLARHWLR